MFPTIFESESWIKLLWMFSLAAASLQDLRCSLVDFPQRAKKEYERMHHSVNTGNYEWSSCKASN